tara:strand:+ start:417 stop:572 length:156 start_codon:yes stop_codon:yes gene_type:complete
MMDPRFIDLEIVSDEKEFIAELYRIEMGYDASYVGAVTDEEVSAVFDEIDF